MSVITRTREWLLQRDLESRVAKVPAERREKTSPAFRISEQRRSAAEALWVAGFPAEALRLLGEAINLANGAIEAEPRTFGFPALDEDVTREHGAEFRDLLIEHTRICRAHEDLALDAKGVARRRTQHLTIAASIALAAVGALYLVLRTPRTLKATSSANYDGRYDPNQATDGNESTDWLLPDRTAGWIDLQVIPPRKVSKVKLLNARNLPYSDRATHEFKVDAFFNGQPVATATGKFDGFSPEPTWRTVDINQKVDRIRVEVKSWHLSGGGFSEIEAD